MRIIFFIGQLGLGGGERQLYLLLKRLDKTKFTLEVICFNENGNYWGPFISGMNIHVHYLANKSIAKRVFCIWKIIRATKPDIGVSWDIQTNPYLALLNKVYRFKKIYGGVRCNLYKSDRSRMDRFIRTVGLNYFITNSQQGVAGLSKLGKLNVEVLHNAVEVNFNGKKDIFRKFSGITDHEPIILFTGSFKKEKNPTILLNAFIKISKDIPAQLVFIGDGVLKNTLEERAASSLVHNKIHFLGKVEMAGQFMKYADIFCLTSSAEGMPNALLEASAAGLPVIASDVGGVREVVEENVTGYIFSPENEEELISYLLHLLKNPGLRKKMGQAGNERMIKYFSEKAMSTTFEKIVSQ